MINHTRNPKSLKLRAKHLSSSNVNLAEEAVMWQSNSRLKARMFQEEMELFLRLQDNHCWIDKGEFKNNRNQILLKIKLKAKVKKINNTHFCTTSLLS